MTESDLQAYLVLCALRPECKHPNLNWSYDQQAWFTSLTGHQGVDIPTFWSVALIVDHLERLLPPGKWSYMDGAGYSLSGEAKSGRFGRERTHTLYRGARLSALLSAVEAVMEAKGGVG